MAACRKLIDMQIVKAWGHYLKWCLISDGLQCLEPFSLPQSCCKITVRLARNLPLKEFWRINQLIKPGSIQSFCSGAEVRALNLIMPYWLSVQMKILQWAKWRMSQRCWGRGRKFSSYAGGLFVLSACKEAVASSWVPPEVRPADSEAVREIVKANETPPAPDDFSLRR